MKKRTLAQKKRILQELNISRSQTGLPVFEGMSRTCLKCGRSFFSMGKWNRICEGCASIMHKKEESMEIHSVGF